MCELLGLSFNKLVSPRFSFAGLLTQTHRHKNGWGLGSYPDGSSSAQVFKEPITGKTSSLADFISAPQQLHSKTFVGHIRMSSCGGDSYDNTHPFNRFYCYREWLFAHNGTLRDTSGLQSKFLPLGQTDSEKSFCYLLGKMGEKRLRPTSRGNYIGFDSNAIAGIREILLDINNRGDGPFNCIFTDGTYLFCYRDISGRRDLYYLERKAPFQRTVMRDTEMEIDLNIEKSQDEVGVIVASNMLTDEGWTSFAPGELKVWKNGIPVDSRLVPSETVIHCGAILPQG